MKTSQQSYADFVPAAFRQMEWGFTGDAGQDISQLYGLYKTYNPTHVAPKVPLTDDALDNEMVGLMGAFGVRTVSVQGRGQIPDNADFATFYTNGGGGLSNAEQRLANYARGGYLHVTPTDGRNVLNNWRIGLNIHPENMSRMAGKLMTIMDNYNLDIKKIKFLGPRSVSKPDSAIIYMRRRDATYDQIKADVRTAVVEGLNETGNDMLQLCFSPLWNEFSPGMAEAAEPPTNGGSFGTYRCIILWLSYFLGRNLVGDGFDLNDFRDSIDVAAAHYGFDENRPHWQDQLDAACTQEDKELFARAYALHKGHERDYYVNAPRLLTNRTALP